MKLFMSTEWRLPAGQSQGSSSSTGLTSDGETLEMAGWTLLAHNIPDLPGESRSESWEGRCLRACDGVQPSRTCKTSTEVQHVIGVVLTCDASRPRTLRAPSARDLAFLERDPLNLIYLPQFQGRTSLCQHTEQLGSSHYTQMLVLAARH